VMEYTDEEGIVYRSYHEYVEDLCGLCECRDDDIPQDIFTVLEKYRTSEYNQTSYTDFDIEGPLKYKELLLHLLDGKGLLEHGTSIRGSWLTDKGKKVANGLANEI
jgi:hypothetical protein